MRVLLLYSNQSRELVPAPPVGLSYVASAAEAAGHEVRLLDLAFSTDLLAELAQAITAFAPEVVGLSVRNIDNVIQQRFDSPLLALQQQVAVIRDTARTADGRPVPLVLGGPAISILAERTLDVFGADYAVVGEGEAAFPALLGHIAAGTLPQRIPGVCYRRDGVAVRNPSELIAGFADSGMQRWIDWRRYEHEGGTWPIQTKRGCPMSCVYCAYPLVEGRRFRQREPGEVVDEIARVLRDVGPRTFEFVDSTFNLPARHAIAICEEILRRGVKAKFTAMGINPLDVPAELFPLMKRAGFNSMMITPEAACDAMLDNLGKGFSMQHVNRCLDLARTSGLKSMWFFMLGGPGETMATCEESIRFAQTRLTGWQFTSVFFTGIRILPGTVLARQAIERGYLAPDTDFANGVFYLSPEIDEAAVLARVHEAVTRNPSIVQAAEGGTSATQHALYRTLRLFGVAPPYWRFLPTMLSFPPLHYLRSRYPSVVAGKPLPTLCEA
ncbi:MAG TPA: cobalamin-dependent protein [Azonexus sp.]